MPEPVGKKEKPYVDSIFPFSPMPNTVVLDPILDEEQKALGNQNFHKIAKLLSDMKSNDAQECNF